jgi:hypothetical protein
MRAQLEQARTAEQQASNTAADAATRLAAAEARAETLQKAHDALLQRIVPETPDKDDRAKRTSGGSTEPDTAKGAPPRPGGRGGPPLNCAPVSVRYQISPSTRMMLPPVTALISSSL